MLKQMGATAQGQKAVDDIVSEVEKNMQYASDITNVLSSGSVTGMVNSMSFLTGGVPVDEEELMQELDLLAEGGSAEDGGKPSMLKRLELFPDSSLTKPAEESQEEEEKAADSAEDVRSILQAAAAV